MGKGVIELPPRKVYDSIRNPQLRFTYDNMLKVHTRTHTHTHKNYGAKLHMNIKLLYSVVAICVAGASLCEAH